METEIEESITHDHSTHAFYADVPWDVCGIGGVSGEDNIEGLLRFYFDKYVVGYEISKNDKVPHIHVVAYGTAKQYNAYIAQIKKLYDLKGRATKGSRKQYGKVRDIKDLDNMISYTVKSGHYHSEGYDADYIQQRASVAYEKPTFKSKFDVVKEQISALHQRLRGDNTKFGLEDARASRKEIVEKAIQLHYEHFGTVLSTPTLKRYLYAANILDSGEIAEDIGRFYIFSDITYLK